MRVPWSAGEGTPRSACSAATATAECVPRDHAKCGVSKGLPSFFFSKKERILRRMAGRLTERIGRIVLDKEHWEMDGLFELMLYVTPKSRNVLARFIEHSVGHYYPCRADAQPQIHAPQAVKQHQRGKAGDRAPRLANWRVAAPATYSRKPAELCEKKKELLEMLRSWHCVGPQERMILIRTRTHTLKYYIE